MKPPICAVCGREFAAELQSGEGALVSFRPHEDEEFPPGHTGHPSNQEWFCPEHVGAARDLTHLTLPEAMERLDDRE